MLRLGLLAWAELWFLLFLGRREETNPLSVWSCPSFRLIRVSEAKNPINYSVLEDGELHLFHVSQSLVWVAREGPLAREWEAKQERKRKGLIISFFDFRGPLKSCAPQSHPHPWACHSTHNPNPLAHSFKWSIIFPKLLLLCTSLSLQDGVPSEHIICAPHLYVEWINERTDAW